MGNANAKLWEAVEGADVRTLCEVLKHKEVDIDHRKEYKLGRRNWNQGNGGNGSDESGSPSSLSSIITPDGTSGGGGGGGALSEMKHMFQGVDKDVLTPLHVACMRGNREIVALLMAHGADIHIKAVHERYGPASLRAFRKRGRKILKRYEEEGYIDDPQQQGGGAAAASKLHKSAKEINHGNTLHRLNVNGHGGGRPGGHQRSFSSTTGSSTASALQPYRLGEDAMHRHVSHDEGGLSGAATMRVSSRQGGRGDNPLDGMDYIKYCQYTALYYACKYRSKEVAYDLTLRHIEDSARVRSTRGGTTDAEKAASIEKKLKGILTNNWVVFIELLIDHRADFVASLCDAAARGDLQIVELLLGLGANVNGEESETVEKVVLERKPSKWDTTTPYEYISREDRPLYIACHNGQREVVEYFLQMGAIVQDEDVSTALESGFRDIAMLLLDAQAQQSGQSRSQQEKSHMPATSSPAIEHSIYPIIEPQLPPRIQSPPALVVDQPPQYQFHQQQQQQQSGLYPPQQQPYLQTSNSYAPITYQQMNSYRGGQQSTPPDSPPQGSPPSPVGGLPAHHIPAPSPRGGTPDPYGHHQVMSTSTTPTGSPQLYSSASMPQPQLQRNIYGAYAPAEGGVGRPYFAQPQAAYHPAEHQPRAATPQPVMPAPAPYYPSQQQQQQAAGPPPSYMQHIVQQQQQAQAQAQAQQQAATNMYQSSAMVYAQIPMGQPYPRAVPPIPAPQPVYQQQPQPQQPNLYQPQPPQQSPQPAPSPHLRLNYGPGAGHFVAPSAPAYMPPPAQPQGYGLAPPVPPHQRKPSEGGLAGAMPVPKSDGAMVLSETGSSDYIHNEYEVDYSEVEVEKELARGSFGIVFTGRWRGTDVAIKKLVNQNLSQKELEEFHAEVNVMKKLHHPNVLLLMGVCSQPPNLCMICELMTGSLWDLLHRRKEVRLDWKLVMRFITDTARGMNYLHLFKPPVLHRDLKTPNLLVPTLSPEVLQDRDHTAAHAYMYDTQVDKDFNVKIADFGLARLKAHVMTGNLGTCQYMAPEVLRNESYTESADVYSFGIIVWEIVARAPPFHGMQTMQIAYSVNQGMRPPIPAHCPPPLRDLMQRCWNQDPRLRPSFTAILNQIKGIKL